MGGHLLRDKRMHSSRKIIPTKGIKGIVHKKREYKERVGLLINLKGMYGHRYKII